MRRRWPTVIRGLAAAALLLGVLAGVPILLAREVGWPLPTAVPALDDVGRAMTSGAIADATIVKTLAVLVWLAWANFAAGLVTEAVAVIRGRPARQVGGFRTGQQVAGRLLSTISLAVVTLSRPEVAAAVGNSDLRLAVATAAAEPALLAMPVGGAGIADETPPVGGVATSQLRDGDAVTRLHEVERGDTFWDLAERFLGDGLRWREIRDANIGRVQPDGRQVDGTTEELHVGWTLRIPGGGEERTTDGEEVIVERGDTLWDLAEENLDDGHRWPEIYELNRGDPQPAGGALVDPDLLQPGWKLSLPGGDVVGASDLNGAPTETTRPEPGLEEDETPTPARPVDDTKRDDVAADVDPRPVPSDNRGGTGTVGTAPQSAPAETIDRLTNVEEPDALADDESVPLLVPGVFAAGVVLTLDRIRRTRMRKREPGKRIPLPDGEDAAGEQRLRATRDDDTSDFLNLGLRELSHLMGDEPLPRVRMVTVDADDLRVHFDEKAPSGACPDPWRPWDATAWLRPRPGSLDSLRAHEGVPARLPALVTLGRTIDERLLFLNLAGETPVQVTADPACGQVLLHTWALELATSPRADALDLITVGIDGVPEGLERLEEAEPGELQSILDGIIDAGGTAGPTTVVLSAGASEHDVEGLTAATSQREAVASVVLVEAATGAVAGRRIDVREGRVASLEPDGLEVELLEPCCTPPMTARLLEQALHDPDQLAQLPQPETESGHEVERETELITGVVEEPADLGTVEVRILGPVEIVRAPGPFRTTKTIELITYLAMHRSGADTDTLMEALWPNQPPRAARLHTEASRARKALGSDAGNPRLPSAELGRYRLSRSVVLDHDHFEVAVGRARQEPECATDHLQTALSLVCGIPLSSTAYEYAWAANDTHRITQQVVDTAHMLVELALESQQVDLATWAAEQGLLACPHAEPLYRDLMRSAAARGDIVALPTVMGRLRSVVSQDMEGNEADDWLALETVSLYERLGKQLRLGKVG